MNRALSNRIRWLNFIFTLCIVIQHCTSMAPADIWYTDFTDSIRFFAMFFFFCISGYLFFRTYSPDQALKKIWQRVYSLLVPFLLWDGIGFLFYSVKRSLAAGSLKTPSWNEVMASLTFRHAYGRINFDGPIWFLTMLFILILAAPLIYYLIKNKWAGWIFTLVLGLASVYFKADYYNPFFWMPSFVSGGMFALHYQNLFAQNASTDRWIIKTLITAWPFVLLFGLSFGYSWYSIRWIVIGLLKVLAIPALMIALGSISWPHFSSSAVFNSFWIFVSHYLFMGLFKEIFERIGLVPSLSSWMLLIILTLIFSMVSGWIVSKLLPKIYKVLCGGRA